MNLLITGGAGYIGTHTIVELIKAGHSVVAVDNLSKNSGDLIKGVEEIVGTKIDFYNIDTRNFSALDKLFSANEFDAVIHFAAFKAVGESVEKPLDYYENNIMSLITLCRVMEKHKAGKLIFSSSGTVYGQVDTAVTETMNSVNGECPYGWTKVFCERILTDLVVSDPNFWDITLLRYFNPVGNHSSGLIGEDSEDVPPNLLPYLTKVAAGELKELTVFGGDYDTRDGTCERDYIHVVDLAKGHVAALANDSHGIKTYNLGSGKSTTVLEIIDIFEKATGKTVPYKIGDRRPGDIIISYAKVNKAKDELSWETELSLDQAMQDQWAWQNNSTKTFN